MEQSFFKKIGMIAVLVIMLAVPLEIILSVIRERSARRDEAYHDIAATWGAAQHITGPVLTVPYYDGEGELNHGYFLPENLDILVELTPETRYRGIFEVIVYRSVLTVTGAFGRPDFAGWGIEDYQILWDKAALTLGISGLRGVQEVNVFEWNEQPAFIRPGADPAIHGLTGFLEPVSAEGAEAAVPVSRFGDANTFRIDLIVNGSRQLAFSPSAGTTLVQVSSPWAHPGFNGSYLPASRTITEEGFTANWQISSFGRDYPDRWHSGDDASDHHLHMMNTDAFGVELIQPVNFYTKSERSVKYGLLIICLTFLCFFMFEILNTLKIHPMQYLLVGFGLSIFYLLLVSFAEQMGFLPAYVVSSIACVGLITAYTRSFLNRMSATLITGAVLSGFFALFYIILRHEGYSLVIGSSSLFAILALVMWLTRKLDWYTTFSVRLPKPVIKRRIKPKKTAEGGVQ